MSRGTCFHCGLPLPAGTVPNVTIDGIARAMCCAGCAAVAGLIRDSGLAGYYRHREAPGERPADPGEGAGEYAIYDLPEANSGFVEPPGADGIARAALAIDGVHCAACTWLLEKHLGARPGIVRIDVSLAERRASVRWRPAELPLSRLMAAIRSLGFQPRPWIASQRQQALRIEGRSLLRRMGVAGLVQMQIGMFALSLYAGAFEGIEAAYRDYLRWTSLLLCIPVMLYSATPFFAGAWRGLRHGSPGMDLPVALAIGLAFAASAWFTWTGGGEVYFDSVSMFAFLLLLGRYLELRARERAGLAGGGALALLPDAALRLLPDGRREQVPVSRLRPGDTVLVRPGESFPADGCVRAGDGTVDESSLSGESIPVPKHPGAPVSAGSLSVDASLQVEVRATGLQSRLGQLLALVDRASADKPPIVQLADRSAGFFVAAVLVLATLGGAWWLRHAPERALEIVLSVLVVSCPCALSLATPAALTAAGSRLRQRGFLITRSPALEGLARASLAVFDKTGTLTDARLQCVETVTLPGEDPLRCAAIAASLESGSAHPIAAAFPDGEILPLTALREFPGSGVEGWIDGHRYRIGTPAFAAPQAITQPPSPGKWILLGDGAARTLAWFRLADTVRPDAGAALAGLRALGLDIALLSGDSESEVSRLATSLGIRRWRSGCSAEDKLAALAETGHPRSGTLMVGDGLNDLAVLAGAGVSVAVANAVDFTRASADCIVLSGGLSRLPEAIRVARDTQRIIRQNLAWAVLYNLGSIPFALAGLVSPWLAAAGMSLSSLLVVVNALRLRKDAPSSTPG